MSFSFDKDTGKVVLVNKPLEWTSFDVVNKIRYALLKFMHRQQVTPGIKPKVKVGHAGTLDPLATGLLIVCMGKETKNIDSYMATEKEYTGAFFIGATTPSYDRETEVNAIFETTHITPELIHSTAKQFIGETDQLPPVFSAIKKEGKKLYESARAGEEVILTPRKITLYEFEITAIEMPLVYFRVVCSKGTYIRSLAYDFGKALNSGAYLHSLCRTRSGNFHLKDAYELADLIEQIQS